MKLLVLFASTTLLCAAAFAQARPAAPAAPPMPPGTIVASTPGRATPIGKVSIDLASADIRDALRSLASQTGVKILIGSEVTGKVTTKLENVSLDVALSTLTAITSTRWSAITLPRTKVGTITAEEAASIVTAADTLAASGASVVSPGRPQITLASATNSATTLPAMNAEDTVYLVQTRIDPAAIKAAREDAKKRASDQSEADQMKAVAQGLSDDAKQDPAVVKAYSMLQNMNPDEVATLAREFVIHASPEQRQAIGEAMARQRDRFRQGAGGGPGQ